MLAKIFTSTTCDQPAMWFSLEHPPSTHLAAEIETADDNYDGKLVVSSSLPTDPRVFASRLRHSLERWTVGGTRGVWLKLGLIQSALIPEAVNQGFVFHHAERVSTGSCESGPQPSWSSNPCVCVCGLSYAHPALRSNPLTGVALRQGVNQRLGPWSPSEVRDLAMAKACWGASPRRPRYWQPYVGGFRQAKRAPPSVEGLNTATTRGCRFNNVTVGPQRALGVSFLFPPPRPHSIPPPEPLPEPPSKLPLEPPPKPPKPLPKPLPEHHLKYLLNRHLKYLLNHLLNYPLNHLPNHLVNHLLNHLLSHLLNHLVSHLPPLALPTRGYLRPESSLPTSFSST